MEIREDRPAYVRFETRAVEDRAKSIERGMYMTRDVDYALITPPYSKDCVELEVGDWMRRMDEDVQGGRLPSNWRDQYKAAYAAWKKGEEVPVDGTPVKGWPVISPAQQKNLVSLGFLTVEDLAGMNEEGMKRYGMGAQDMKNKAKAWLKAATGPGKVAAEIAALQADMKGLKEQNDRLIEQNKELAGQVEALTRKKAA